MTLDARQRWYVSLFRTPDDPAAGGAFAALEPIDHTEG